MKRLIPVLIALALAPCGSAAELETFTARGNPKALGLDFSIGRPKAWMTRDAMNPGELVVWWQAPRGLVDSMKIILPRTAGTSEAEVTKEDFRETFENPQLEQMLGRSLPGAKFLRKVSLADFKYPAGFLEYAARYRLPAGEVELRVRNYLVYLGSVMLQIQFHLVQGAGEDRLKEFDDEMKHIVATLEFTRP